MTGKAAATHSPLPPPPPPPPPPPLPSTYGSPPDAPPTPFSSECHPPLVSYEVVSPLLDHGDQGGVDRPPGDDGAADPTSSAKTLLRMRTRRLRMPPPPLAAARD